MIHDILMDVQNLDIDDIVFEPEKYNLTIDQAAKLFKEQGLIKYSLLCLGLRKTEKYVRYWGKEIKLGKYQVFNPTTGIHTRYDTLDEAKQALIQVCENVLQNYAPSIVREISNELGDTAWSNISLENKVSITLEE